MSSNGKDNIINRVKESKSKFKFTLNNLLHRIQRLHLTSDVVIDNEIINKYKVAWVDLRGSQDPIYISRSVDYLNEYRDQLSIASSEEDKDEEDKLTRDATLRFTAVSVACSIEKWDEDFFGRKFDIEYAIELFQKQENFLVYNQIAVYIQKSIDFLPNASQPQ